MSPTRLTGSRIRERRLVNGVKQADLARAVGISPAYLNLIEHNRRRIGGKLLVDLARGLGVEPGSLSEGAETALLAAMRAAAARGSEVGAEVDRAEELAGRFPGWAGLITTQHRRIRELEHLVEGLSDRLTHDPHLAASLHDVLTTVTAIRSTVSILTDAGDIDPDRQVRFLRNVGEDSTRLSESAQSLVRFLVAGQDVDTGHIAPQEEVSAFLEANQYYFAGVEAEGAAAIPSILAQADTLNSHAARQIAQGVLELFCADAKGLSEPAFRSAWGKSDGDPAKVATQTGVDLACVLRRAAILPPPEGQGPFGLVLCDGSGTLTLRKPVRGFVMPRFGAACPLWPLYQALARPAQPVRAAVEMPGVEAHRFDCLAISQPRYPAGFAAPPVFEATMLILPGGEPGPVEGNAWPIGTSCRICPRDGCSARREPSILGASPRDTLPEIDAGG